MTDATTTISVRGEARHVVPPDFVVIGAAVNIRDTEKQVTLDRAGRAQSAVLDALRERGGTALTVASVEAPLTWATRTFTAQHEEGRDERKARRDDGWRVHVPITVTVRELSLLDGIATALSSLADVDVWNVRWQVDARNPAWPVVRAAAIEDAIEKARDYAAALGGEVLALVHVADEGLLGGQEGHGRASGRVYSASGVAEADGGPALDPAPQEIAAVIEARFEARIDPL
jgi:hypothetical protein